MDTGTLGAHVKMQNLLRTSLCALAVVATPFVLSAKPTEPTSARMLAALETVKPENLKSDLYFIASDEMKGRDTPSEEQRITARFLRARLERLGWKPGAREGYLYPYDLEQRLLDETKCNVTFTTDGKTESFAFASDYFLSGSFDVRTGRASGKLVFAGEGSKANFESKALENAWALCFDGGDPIGEVAARARKAKCAGLVIAPGPDYKGAPWTERFKGQLERQRKGSVRPIEKDQKKAAEPEPEKRAPFSTVALTRAAVERVLALSRESATPRVGSVIGDFVEERAIVGDGRVQAENVCGLWPGSDPELGAETIILSAHYDHIGVSRDGQINNGADDNGSGTSGMLAIAEALAQHGPLRRSVMIIWVSGEEKGLWGSQAWTDDPFLPDGRRPICDINIDMIGRNAPDKLLVTPTSGRKQDYNGLVRLTESLAPSEGFPDLGSADAYYTRSDHANFAKLGIPVMFLFSDVHEDYHRPTDDADKIDFDKVRRVSRLVLRILDALQADKLEIGPVH